MNIQEKEAIKQTMNTDGWPLIMGIFKEELQNKYVIKTEDRSYEDIAVECMANEKANEAVNGLLSRLLIIDNEKKVQSIDYI